MTNLKSVSHGFFGSIKINLNLFMVSSFLRPKSGEHLWEQSTLNLARTIFRPRMLEEVRRSVPIHGNVIQQEVSFTDKQGDCMSIHASLTFKDGTIVQWSSKVTITSQP